MEMCRGYKYIPLFVFPHISVKTNKLIKPRHIPITCYVYYQIVVVSLGFRHLAFRNPQSPRGTPQNEGLLLRGYIYLHINLIQMYLVSVESKFYCLSEYIYFSVLYYENKQTMH